MAKRKTKARSRKAPSRAAKKTAPSKDAVAPTVQDATVLAPVPIAEPVPSSTEVNNSRDPTPTSHQEVESNAAPQSEVPDIDNAAATSKESVPVPPPAPPKKMKRRKKRVKRTASDSDYEDVTDESDIEGAVWKWVTLTLIRHGQCISNVTRRYKNDSTDDLTERGEMQATVTGKLFANVRVDALYASPLIRAEKTARIFWNERRRLVKPIPWPDASASPEPAGGKSSTQSGSVPEKGTIEGIEQTTSGEEDSEHKQNVGDKRARPQDGPSDVLEEHASKKSKLADRAAARAYLLKEWRWLDLELLDLLKERNLDRESEENVERRGVQVVLKMLETHGVELPEGEEPKIDLNDPAWKEPGKIPEGVPHVVLVGHNVALCELIEAVLGWNEEQHCDSNKFFNIENASWERLVLRWRESPRRLPKTEEKRALGYRGWMHSWSTKTPASKMVKSPGSFY